jgi:dihydroorotate dehydrogenase
VFYEQIVRRILFSMDPEDAHLRTMRGLSIAGAAFGLAPWLRVRDARLEVDAFGLTFPSSVGLAAGLDKHGEAVAAWPAVGAGFVEVGTVTPRPQSGNPRPRLFRLPEDRALVNRMGFNSVGAEAVARHLAGVAHQVPIGINIGKNRDTPNDGAAADYERAASALKSAADYFVINVSSPNTAGLRDLQRPESVHGLVTVVKRAAPGKPVLVKISPDLDAAQIDETVEAIVTAGADGIIATNTTTARAGLTSPRAGETGGLSGAPLRDAAQEACRRVFRRTRGRVPIVGVGGIFTAEDAYARVRAGASLLQIYTALIYEGPALFGRLHRGLLRLMERDGLPRISAAVGLDAQAPVDSPIQRR